jgi:hypothetical protein
MRIPHGPAERDTGSQYMSRTDTALGIESWPFGALAVDNGSGHDAPSAGRRQNRQGRLAPPLIRNCVGLELAPPSVPYG